MLNKKKYFDEVENLKLTKKIDEKKLELLFDVATGYNKVGDNKKFTNEILEELFNMPTFKELLIPLNFYDTEIGKAIIQVRWAMMTYDFYLIQDVANVIGKSVQWLTREANQGNIVGEQRGKIWVFKSTDVDDYIAKKLKKKGNKDNVEYRKVEEKIIDGKFEREVEYK